MRQNISAGHHLLLNWLLLRPDCGIHSCFRLMALPVLACPCPLDCSKQPALHWPLNCEHFSCLISPLILISLRSISSESFMKFKCWTMFFQAGFLEDCFESEHQHRILWVQVLQERFLWLRQFLLLQEYYLGQDCRIIHIPEDSSTHSPKWKCSWNNQHWSNLSVGQGLFSIMLMSLLTLLHGLISMNQSPGKQCITSITSSVLTENRMMWFRIIIFIIMALTFMIVHDLKLFLPQDCFFKDFLIILEINGQCCLNMKLLL